MSDTDTDARPDGANVPTLEELINQRAEAFDEADKIIRTARDEKREPGDDGRILTEDERTEYDAHMKRYQELDEEVRKAETSSADRTLMSGHEQLSRSFNVPNINLIADPPPVAHRSLDELLWASADTVKAGQFDTQGNFYPNPHGAHNRVEPVTVESRSGDSVPSPRIDEFRPDHQAQIRNFQRTVADMVLFGLLTDKKAKTSEDGFSAAKSHRAFSGRWETLMRAMDVDTSAEGGAWVPTGIGADLHEKVRAAGRVAALFTRIDMPTNPWKWPIEGADATAYRVAEPTGDTETKMTASTPGTVAATFDAEIFGARALFSRSLDADSALAILPYVRGKLAQAFSDAEEKAILDGDTDGTHQDSDVGASTTDARTAWDGLRKKALAQTSSDASNAAVTQTLMRTARGLMGKWGLNPASLAVIIGVSAYYDLIDEDDFRTVDKFGPQAVVLNGQLGAFDGIPVVVSEHVREDLNASGVHDGITTNRSYALVVNRGEFAMGQRMGLDVEVDDSIYRETFQRVVVGFQREDYQHIGDAAANDDVAVLFNVA